MIKLEIPKELQQAEIAGFENGTVVVPIFKNVEVIGKAHIKRDAQSKDYYAEMLIVKDAQEKFKIEENPPFVIVADILEVIEKDAATEIKTFKIKALSL